jgi:hypothetical protein
MTTHEIKGNILIWKSTTTPSKSAQENMKEYVNGDFFFGTPDTDNVWQYNEGAIAKDPATALIKGRNDAWLEAFAEPNPIPKIVEIVSQHDVEFSFRGTLESLKEKNTKISGIHALKLCSLFNVGYEKQGGKLVHIGFEELISVLSPDMIDGTVKRMSTDFNNTLNPGQNLYIQAIFIYTTLAIFINYCIDKLNDAFENHGLREIRFKHMSTDGSLTREPKTFKGGAMLNNSKSVNVELVKKAIMGYSVDFKNYMFGGIPANFEMNYDGVGGVIIDVNKIDPINKNRYVTSNAKGIADKNSNRSSDFFAKAFQEIQVGARHKNMDLDPVLVRNINDAINSLRTQEEALLKHLDSGIIGVVTGRSGKTETTPSGTINTITDANGDDIKAYEKLFGTVNSIARKEARIYGALVGILHRVAPGYYLPVSSAPVVPKKLSIED